MHGGQPGRHGVGVARRLQPQVAVEIGVELGGDEARLGEQLGGALAQEVHFLGAVEIEQDHRLGAPAAVLGAAEGDDVDAALPGHFGRRGVERHQRVGKARAVHVQRQRMALGDGRDGRDLVEAVDGADLGRLGDRNRHRPAGMDEFRRETGDRALETCRVDAAERPVDRVRAASRSAKIFRRAAFVLDDMRLAMAEGDAAGLGVGGERQRVGGRAGRHEEHRHLALEDLAEALVDGAVEIAVAIGRG